jgi:hypothetical protein
VGCMLGYVGLESLGCALSESGCHGSILSNKCSIGKGK